jgi:hypothetical protein
MGHAQYAAWVDVHSRSVHTSNGLEGGVHTYNRAVVAVSRISKGAKWFAWSSTAAAHTISSVCGFAVMRTSTHHAAVISMLMSCH